MTTDEKIALNRQWRETGWGEIIQFGDLSSRYEPIEVQIPPEPQTSSYGLANVLGEPRTRSIKAKESFPWRFGLLVATVLQGGIVAVIWFALWAWLRIESWMWRMAR